jgi:hypothetical protein
MLDKSSPDVDLCKVYDTAYCAERVQTAVMSSYVQKLNAPATEMAAAADHHAWQHFEASIRLSARQYSKHITYLL